MSVLKTTMQADVGSRFEFVAVDPKADTALTVSGYSARSVNACLCKL